MNDWNNPPRIGPDRLQPPTAPAGSVPPAPAVALPRLAPPLPAIAPPLSVPDPEVLKPVSGVLATAEAMLRRPNRVRYQLSQPGSARLIVVLTLIAVVNALIYGLVIGAFSGGDQLWAAPLKTSLGLLLCAAICLPSLFIFCCLDGAEARLTDVAGLVAGLLALLTLLLIGFAPVAWVFSQSTDSAVAMGALHLVFWAIATGFGLRFLSAGVGALRARTRGGLVLWTATFVLVMLQMTTALRPLVGTSSDFLPKDKKFFLNYWAECLKGERAKPQPDR
jgi:hypothetical protein